MTDYRELAETLDEGPFEVTKWEADFLASLLDKGPPYSQKQCEVLERMAEKYLQGA